MPAARVVPGAGTDGLAVVGAESAARRFVAEGFWLSATTTATNARAPAPASIKGSLFCFFAGAETAATGFWSSAAVASRAVANANVSAAWPEGNEFAPLRSGRSRLVVYFNACVRASAMAID